MKTSIEHQLSPSYSHEKLENPGFSDLVDVFEDLWRGYIFTPAESLLKIPNGDVAAMSLLCPYFEAIASHVDGIDTEGKSKIYFVKGFLQVFQSTSPDIEQAARHIYKHIRNGLAHEGMLSHKISYSRLGAKAFYLTYKKSSDGSLETSCSPASIIVNPERIFQSIMYHFETYLQQLRESESDDLGKNFRSVVERQWVLGGSENVVAITESEFLGNT